MLALAIITITLVAFGCVAIITLLAALAVYAIDEHNDLVEHLNADSQEA